MFFMLNLFWFWVFVFGLFSGSPKWVNQVRSKLSQTSKALFGLPLFLQKDFWPNEVFDQYTLRLVLTIFSKKKIGLVKHGLTK